MISPGRDWGKGNSNAVRLPRTPTKSSMPRISSQRIVVCVIRTQRHSASAVAGERGRLKGKPRLWGWRLTEPVRKPNFLWVSLYPDPDPAPHPPLFVQELAT